MKVLGIDYGSKWVGLALSDERGTIAFPRAEIENDRRLLGFLVRLVEEEEVGLIVVGDTLSAAGGRNRVTDDAESFIVSLAQATATPVESASEAWTSAEAARFAPKGERHNNAAAAAVLLQRYLDMRGSAPLPESDE